jgi:hypothetical protein
LEFWTEDGTDGFKPLPTPSRKNKGTGVILEMLEGRVTGPLEALSSSARLKSPGGPNLSAMDSKGTAKAGRMRQLIDAEGDVGTGLDSPSNPAPKRQKVTPGRRELLSPDLAAKNKGRGRYAESVLKRCVSTLPI